MNHGCKCLPGKHETFSINNTLNERLWINQTYQILLNAQIMKPKGLEGLSWTLDKLLNIGDLLDHANYYSFESELAELKYKM